MPALSLYVPTGHGAQDPASSPKNPWPHKQGDGPGEVFTEPIGQATQGPPSGPKKPAVDSDLPLQEHLVGLSLPGGDSLLAGQLWQSSELDAPRTLLYVAAGQSEHAAEPNVNLNLPEAHGGHASPLLPVYPGSHSHLAVWATVLMSTGVACRGHGKHVGGKTFGAEGYFFNPPSQLEHFVEPFPALKVPGVHAVHGPPSRPSKSSRHRHLDLLELPCGEILYAAQSLHDDSAVARVASEYLPLAHRSHLSEPGADEKDPGAHGVHGPPLGPKNPLAHRQSVSPLLPQGDTELRGHSRHALAEIAPSSVEKKSSGHCVQDSVPASFL